MYINVGGHSRLYVNNFQKQIPHNYPGPYQGLLSLKIIYISPLYLLHFNLRAALKRDHTHLTRTMTFEIGQPKL